MNSLGRIDTLGATAVDTRARFTAAEFLKMVETGAFSAMRVELIDGVLERMTPPMSGHGQRQFWVGLALASVLPKERLTVETGISVDADTVLICDVAALYAPVEQTRILEPSDVMLVIEIAETTVSRDKDIKRIKYASAGIETYWVVDSVRSAIHVFTEPLDGDYAAINTVRFGQPLAVPGAGTIVID
ncbi:Uma2 family endonuclease [Sphingomonas sp. NFR15]|uniref:Uma2 family endonuclease n=1 Tax=Sphingomonas sp. NFR15 TaxID=1566282 RepID=UPI00088A46E0|nr:Uma2 family endonuclease [Sphingomonas sp. NFR15]SDA34915.1 Endonuclease, Uma2 family (restriction endonuclease fold) [Sphingomonas sp. NFR15]